MPKHRHLRPYGLPKDSLVCLDVHASHLEYLVAQQDCGCVLQGLEDAIGLSVTHSTWQRTKPDTDDEHCGWAFASPGDAPLHSSTGVIQHTSLLPV